MDLFGQSALDCLPESHKHVDVDDMNQFVGIICKYIELKDIEISIQALGYLKKILSGSALDPECLKIITDTVTKIEFSSSETDRIEVGYLEAALVCQALVKSKSSYELTNGSISEIIIFCFRIVHSKLVSVLRQSAIEVLESLTEILFGRLKDFPEDPALKPSYQIRLRLGGATSNSTFKELTQVASDSGSNLRIITEKNQPYNLAIINDYFCYLGSLINPSNETEITKNQEEKMLLGLKLLGMVFYKAAPDLSKKSCLTYITKNNICFYIVSILKTSTSRLIVSNTLSLAVKIFIPMRSKLKYQFEALLEALMEMLATDQEFRLDALKAVLRLFRNIRHFPHELYCNYDCDPTSSNIYENLIQICSKNCFQHSNDIHFTPRQMISFKCLLANLGDINAVETSNIRECLDSRCQFAHNLNDAKKRKRLLWLALDKFNSKPKDGIQFIRDNNLINNNDELARFLKDNLRVDKKVLGEFLSKEDNKPIRETFIRSIDFVNLRIDEALRIMLEKFRLPGESQLIERILDSFSVHWFEQNKGILKNSDEALSLAYAIIMLNVDQHSKKVKPMTCDEFDRNLLGPKSDRIYDRKLLDQIYTNIRDNEIVLPGEQVGWVKQRYLWKCIMIKSERPDSTYWLTSKIEMLDGTTAINIEEQLELKDVNKILFQIMWSPTVAALSFIFDKIDVSQYDDLSKHIVDDGFIKFAHLCAKHGHLDNLVVSLCKFTNDLKPIIHNHTGAHRQLLSDKNSLAALSLLSIIRDYADDIRDSWLNIVRNILQWYCSKCIDDVVQVDDFALRRNFRLRMREIKKSPSTMNQQSSTFFRSVYTYFAGSNENGENGANTLDESGKVCEAQSSPPSAIQVLIQTIQNAEPCEESLVELITALTTSSIDGDPEEVEDAEVFKLEIFTQVILNNKDQASKIWPKIRAYFARQLSICGRSGWLGERIISSAFRIAIQFKPKPEVFSLLCHVITALDPEIIRGEHTFEAIRVMTEFYSPVVSMDGKELEICFNQVIFPFLEKVLDGCDPALHDRCMREAINLLSKIFLKHLKLLKELPTFPSLWYKILDTIEKYIKASDSLKESTFEVVINLVLVMDNEQCLNTEMRGQTQHKFLFWGVPLYDRQD